MAGKGSEKTQFKPGESGNPKGRPPSSLTTLLKKEIAKHLKNKAGEFVEHEGVRITAAEAIVRKLISSAINGDMRAMQMLFDRHDGKAVEQIRQQIKLDGAVFCDKDGNKIEEKCDEG